MTGYDKFKQAKEELKGSLPEVSPSAAIEPLTKENNLGLSPELYEQMTKDAEKEASENGGAIPYLKVYDASRSTSLLFDGSRPTHGNFFLTSTQEQFSEIHGHILYISRGFRKPGPPDPKTKEVKNVYQHVVTGLMIHPDTGKMLPFWLVIAGRERLARLWDFQTDFRKKPRSGIATFSLLIHLTVKTVEIENKRLAQVVEFNYVLDENKNMDMVRSMDTYMFLKRCSEEVKEVVKDYIKRHEVITPDEEAEANAYQEAQEVQDQKGVKVEGNTVKIDSTVAKTEEVNPDSIPF